MPKKIRIPPLGVRSRWMGVVIGLMALMVMGLWVGMAAAQSGGGYDLSWWSIDGGGGELQGGSYVLMGSVGQPDAAGPLTGGRYTLYSGFWTPGDGTSVPNCPDPYEPNDGYGQARDITPGSAIQAYICTDQDVDVFKFHVTAGQRITVDLSNIPAGTDYDLWLSDPAYSQVGSSTNPDQADEHIEYTATSSGVYYVGVSSYAGASATQPYHLRVTLSGSSATPSPQRLYLPIISRRH